jgi:aspartate carbamoyltransferase regulatory subunit
MVEYGKVICENVNCKGNKKTGRKEKFKLEIEETDEYKTVLIATCIYCGETTEYILKLDDDFIDDKENFDDDE